MIQSFDTQLQVSVRALREIVAPALAAADKHVVEQLHLVVAALEFMRQRLPAARRYYRDELESYIALSRDSIALVRKQQETLSAEILESIEIGERVLERADAEIEDYQLVTRRLREGLGGLLHHSIGHPAEAALQALVLQKSEATLLAARVWCLPLGFELDPEALPRPDWSFD